jgi:hypothetical protein
VTIILVMMQVDFAVWGHVHNYERTCAVYNGKCLGLPTKDSAGIDTYNNAAYNAPVHAIIGTAGFSLNDFPTNDVSDDCFKQLWPILQLIYNSCNSGF